MVFLRAQYRCFRCGDRAKPDTRTYGDGRILTVDHIVPKARGGSNHISNLRACCSDCNYNLAVEAGLTNRNW